MFVGLEMEIFFIYFFDIAHAYSHQQKLSLRAGLSTQGLKTKSLAKHKKAHPICVYYTHTKTLRAWSCLQWWLSLESSTIPLVRAFIHKSWYFQALCFLLLSWKAQFKSMKGLNYPTRAEFANAQRIALRAGWCRNRVSWQPTVSTELAVIGY